MQILVLQHLPVEHPGVFRDLWRETGARLHTVELDAGELIPPLEAFDLMVVMGGPQDAWEDDLHPWMTAEKAAIRDWVVRLERPFLGLCLGHQLLAAALGGTVGRMRAPEVGLTPVTLTEAAADDPLLAGLGPTLSTFQWHGAEVVRPPDGAVVLAGNAACQVQAMRVGRNAWGLQFHVEITETTVPDWRAIPAYAASLEAALGADGAARLAGDVAARLPAFAATARHVNDNLMRHLGRSAGLPGHVAPPS